MRWISSQRVRAIRALRCPRCLEGAAFRALLAMHERCPKCGLVYEREQGFFLGALYLAYGLGIPILLVDMVLIAVLIDRRFMDSFWPAMLLFMPVTPWIFRYSRILWLHLIQHLDPLRNS